MDDKGPDRVALEIRNGQNCDEIKQYVDGRWICAPKALWRIFSFDYNDDKSKTILTEFFKMNCDSQLTEKYLYREFPQYYTWIKAKKSGFVEEAEIKWWEEYMSCLHLKAADIREILQQDDYVHQCMQEAFSVRMSSSLRRLFLSILVLCEPVKFRELWDEFHPYMYEY
ncbi:uncharacterized protein [Henckelia pumila]|uniref:uncharacterized protein n=1 Tax=Henckelia pumila TaxID=405737 RepID=UPI003C6E9B4B